MIRAPGPTLRAHIALDARRIRVGVQATLPAYRELRARMERAA
jgi:hypothetical protein